MRKGLSVHNRRSRFTGQSSLDFNFLNGQELDPSITFTRTGGTATFFNSAGVLTTAAADQPRFDYNPSTLASLGLLIEEARTNSIRNNTMVGAVAGTPGTLPSISGTPVWAVGAAAGMTTNVIAVGTSVGISYIDLQITGTATGSYIINFDLATAISASPGQTWASSFFISQVGGTTSGITAANLRIQSRDSGGASIASSDSSAITLTGSLTRVSHTATTPALTAFVQAGLRLGLTVSAAIDITLRIGLPQLELGAFATSVIPTTTTALTRNADQASVNTLSPWFNAAEGALYAQYIRAGITPSGGAAGFDDGTANNMIRFVFGTATPANQRFDVNTGGVSQAAVLVNATGVVNTLYKDAGAYKLNDIAATENGAAVGTDNVATIPTVTNLKIGSNAITAYLNGWVQRFTYYPRRLSNAELQALTV